MDERGTYFNLFRNIKDHAVWQNPNLLKFFLWCLIEAEPFDRWRSVTTGRGKTEVFVPRGSFIFGRLQSAKECGLKPSTIRNFLEKLKNLQILDTQQDTQKSSHFTIIKVVNYDKYQPNTNGSKISDVDRQKDRQRTGKGQAKDTPIEYIEHENKSKKNISSLRSDISKKVEAEASCQILEFQNPDDVSPEKPSKSPEPKTTEKARRVMDYFNRRAGTRFRGRVHLKAINARLKEFSPLELMIVVDYMAWQSETYNGFPDHTRKHGFPKKYLTPECIFRDSKFEGRLEDANRNLPGGVASVTEADLMAELEKTQRGVANA